MGFDGLALSALALVTINFFEVCVDDIIAVNALFRPGPMGQNMHYEYADRKNGRKPVEYPHPATVPFLESTYEAAASLADWDRSQECARGLKGKPHPIS